MPIDRERKLRAGAWLYLDTLTEGMAVCDTREEAELHVHAGEWCQVVLQIAEVYPAGRKVICRPLGVDVEKPLEPGSVVEVVEPVPLVRRGFTPATLIAATMALPMPFPVEWPDGSEKL